MKCPRSIPFLHSGLALGAKRHDGFADAWNWLIHSFWHMTMGDGLKWKDKWNGYPKINLAIEAGDGINVKYKNGKVIISTGDGETEDDDYSSGGGGTTSGSDGSDWQDGDGSSDGRRHGDGDIASGGGGVGYDDEDEKGKNDDGDEGEDADDDCNKWTDDPLNSEYDSGMGNPKDDCSALNGW